MQIIKLHKINKYYPHDFRHLGLDVLNWEWKYFIENYLLNYLGKKNISRWIRFYQIVVNNCYNLYRVHKNLIHRDLQSTNIIFYRKKPYFIDFQGIMVGNFMYDLSSLVEDPYVDLPECVKYKIMDFYFKSYPEVNRLSRFYRYYKVQRLVQVLGAFAFLSIHKNKEFFIQQLKNSARVLQNIEQELERL